MEIKADVTLPFPRELVWVTYRNRLADLTEYLPNIRSITVMKREESPGRLHVVNEWFGGGEIPAAVRTLLNESMLKWTDIATWNDETFTVDWRTEVHAFPTGIMSSGVNRFVEVPGGTRLEIRGDLTCDAAKVPGVPRIMAKSINATVEKLFVGKVGVNLVEIGRGVGKLLERAAELAGGQRGTSSR